MNQAKLIETELLFGIDTIQVKSENEGALTQAPFISKNPIKESKSGLFSYILNPDKANGDKSIITFAQYKEICQYMLNELGLENPTITRIDYRLDSYEDDFDELLKLNKLLILLIAMQYNISNRYQSTDLLTQQDLCLRIQNFSFEVENYNKKIQEPTSDVMNRLELRSKRLSKDTNEVNEFNRWIERLDAAATKENLTKLQDKINTALQQRYDEQCSQRGFSKYEFLYRYQGSIFTSAQLSKLYSLFDCKNPNEAAKKYRQRKQLEVISLKDTQTYIEKIKASAAQFFESE